MYMYIHEIEEYMYMYIVFNRAWMGGAVVVCVCVCVCVRVCVRVCVHVHALPTTTIVRKYLQPLRWL